MRRYQTTLRLREVHLLRACKRSALIEGIIKGPLGLIKRFMWLSFSKQWKLEVNSVAFEPEIALDWATGFSPSSNGTIDLRYSTSSTQKATVALQIILWFLAIVALTRALSDVKVDGR